jgi:hypothetical protein
MQAALALDYQAPIIHIGRTEKLDAPEDSPDSP